MDRVREADAPINPALLRGSMRPQFNKPLETRRTTGGYIKEENMSKAQRRAQNISNKPRHIKYHNQKLILSLFRRSEVLSIADIAGHINLSKTTVTKVVNDFVKKGMVLAVGKGNSTDEGGKKPEIFAFNAAWSRVIALSINPDSITGALMDLKCRIISRRTIDCPPDTSYEEAVRDLADMITELLKDSEVKLDPQYIVVGCEGIIDVDNGIIRYTIHHNWGRNIPLRNDLDRALGFSSKIYVDNVLRLAGYADMAAGEESRNSQAVINVTPYSAGGGVLENRRLIYGDNGFVGEVGHMIVEPHSNIRCRCGGFGCFGALVSPETLLARAGKFYPNYPESLIYSKAKEASLRIADIFEASNREDPFACSLMDYAVHYFSIVIHNIVLLRDPEKIIIQGIYSAAGDYFLNGLRKEFTALPFYKTEQNLAITYTAVSGIIAYLIGAGYYAVDVLLDTDSLYD
jgi:predicted NBD/HSP70 family sugar kinase